MVALVHTIGMLPQVRVFRKAVVLQSEYVHPPRLFYRICRFIPVLY